MTPSRRTSTPELASPATTAASRNSPEARGSRPTTATRRAWSRPEAVAARMSCSIPAAAVARSMASWPVRSSPATPRTPSVPKSRPMERSPVVGVPLSPEMLTPRFPVLALGVLRCLPGLLQPILLALLDPRVAGQEAGPLQGRAVLRIHHRERARDPQPQRTCLPGDSAPGDPRDHVELPLGAQGHQRLADELLVHLVGEELLQRPVVDLPLAGARRDADPCDGLLAPAGGYRLAGHHRACRGAAARVGNRLRGVLRRARLGGFLRLLDRSLFDFLRACGLGHGTFLALG